MSAEFWSLISAIAVELIALIGVMYHSNKQFNKMQANQETDHKLIKQEFKDYKEFLHLANKELKDDITTLAKRVDEHNSYGRKIPAIEKDIENIKERLDKLEDK